MQPCLIAKSASRKQKSRQHSPSPDLKHEITAGSVSLCLNRAVPVDVTGTAGIRYDDTSKAFFLENPVAHRVESQAIPKEAEANARQATNNLISAYFKAKPLYVLRDDGTPQEATARWLLKSIRIESGKAIATLSTF